MNVKVYIGMQLTNGMYLSERYVKKSLANHVVKKLCSFILPPSLMNSACLSVSVCRVLSGMSLLALGIFNRSDVIEHQRQQRRPSEIQFM